MVADKSMLFLQSPTFDTARVKSEYNDSWLKPQSDPDGIDSDLAIDIGDFRLRSNLPVLLDNRDSATDPCIIRIHWAPYAKNNRWVHLANSFDGFVLQLEL